MHIGHVLKQLREALDITQQVVADRVGTSRDTVARWERGAQSPRLRHVRALGRALKQDPLDAGWPVAPHVQRQLLSTRRAELLAEDPSLVEVEPDPFGWRLTQVLGWRGLDPWSFATRMRITTDLYRAWVSGIRTPSWAELCRAADLLDVPVWWWRCGGEEEQVMYGPFELRAEDTGAPASESQGWMFAQSVADRHDVPIGDVLRTAYPHWAGWRWRGNLENWRPGPVPALPATERLRAAAERWCSQSGKALDDAAAWISDLCGVSDVAARRWLSGERSELSWRNANLAAAALEVPAWLLWAPTCAQDDTFA